MLTPDEASKVRESVAAVEARVDQSLQKAESAWQALAFVKSLHASLDSVVGQAVRGGVQMDCRAGCSYCCQALVQVTDPEALHIAQHVLGLPKAERDVVIEKLRCRAAHRALVGPPTFLDRQRANAADCAFLEGGLCSIYAIRPSVCRKAHSLSVVACEARTADIPQNLNVLVQCEVLIIGTNRAFSNRGLPAERHELSVAVLAALARENAVDTWFSMRNNP